MAPVIAPSARRMSRVLGVVLVALLLAPPAVGGPDSAEVARALRRGVAWVEDHEKGRTGGFVHPPGPWPPDVGDTGLAARVLARAGRRAGMQRALAWLGDHFPEELDRELPYAREPVWGIASWLLAWDAAREGRTRDAPRALRREAEGYVRWLLDARRPDGLWAPHKREEHGDVVSTAIVLDALRAASSLGVFVPLAPVRDAARALLERQETSSSLPIPAGGPVPRGWGLSWPSSGVRVSSTAAGVLALLAAESLVTAADEEVAPSLAAGITDGIACLDGSFVAGEDPVVRKGHTPLTGPGDPHGLLYLVARIGRMRGKESLNGTRWAEAGAAHLLRTQREDGAWSSIVGEHAEAEYHPTCHALLFLTLVGG